MRKRLFHSLAALLVVLTAAHTAVWAQGVQTGTIRGVVRDAQGLPVPGVTVTATSPALQGPRTVVTDATGSYTLPALPGGAYEVRYELTGFTSVAWRTPVAVAVTLEHDVTLRAGGVTETVTVTAATPPPIATPTHDFNIPKDEVDLLAVPRTIQGIATLAPELTEKSPNVGQLVINGAFAYDNVFMVNGVDVNDNLFANAQNLFIEDAIEETTVLTSGISAEYGRFSGGVINAVTKSGGNAFSGSWRMNLLNPSWSEETPFEKTRMVGGVLNPVVYTDELQQIHEGTFGGPILRDRLWFFTAGRYGSVNSDLTLAQTGVQLVSNDLNKRGELKLTGTVAENHTIQGGYLNNPRTRTNNSGLQGFVIDPNSEVDRSNPNMYYFTNYRGVGTNNMVVEAQYSQRKFKFADDGGTSTDIFDSPFFSVNQCACVYNAPYFDATDPENRNNRQVAISATQFWNKGGRHDTKYGYEFFRSQRTGGNSQSSTGFVFDADFLETASGAPALDAEGRLIPVFVPGESYIEQWTPTRGAEMNVDANSAYIQDRWAVNGNFSIDLGVRFEQVKVKSTGDIVSVNTSPRFVPRLGASYDLKADGSNVVHATYAQYSGRYNEAQVGGNSPVGNPTLVARYYQGPPGQGRNFAPGFNPANYPVNADNLAGVDVPTANIFVEEGLQSPLTHEFTATYGATIGGGRGYAEVAYVARKTTNMVENYTTIDDGFTDVTVAGLDIGTVSNIVYRNSDTARRNYQAMVFQSRYRFLDNLSLNGHYTLQIRNHGNFEGEGSNTPGSSSIQGDYPEATSEARHFPYGRLQNFQRHRMRIWGIYDVNMGRAGDVAVSALWRVESGGVFSLVQTGVAPTAAQRAIMTSAGYPDQLGTASIYFSERGSEEFKGFGLLDTSVSYDVPVFKSLRPWVKFDIYNILNNQKLIAWSTAIRQDPNSPTDALGLRTGFVPTNATTFGTATGNTVSNGSISGIPAFPQWLGGNNGGRTMRVALGLRF